MANPFTHWEKVPCKRLAIVRPILAHEINYKLGEENESS